MSALVAVTTLLGLELLRAFPTLAVWQLGSFARFDDLFGVTVLVAPFLVAALVAVTLLGSRPRHLFLVAGVLLGLSRVAVQLVSPGDAGVALAGVGLAAALVLLGILATMGLPLFGGGVVAGAMLDAALQAGLGTRALVWNDSVWAAGVVMLVVGWHLALVADRARREVFVLGRRPWSAVPLAVIGPLLLVESFMFANLGWVSQTLQLGWFGASVAVGAACGLALLAASVVARRPSAGWLAPTVAGATSMVVLTQAARWPGWWWVPALLMAQVGVAVGLTVSMSRGVGTGSWRTAGLALGVGWAATLAGVTTLDGRGIFGFPVAPTAALGGAGVLLAAAGWFARRELAPRPHRPGRIEVVSLCGVFIVPAALLAAGLPVLVRATPAAATLEAEVRVVTYNVALAFDPAGRPNLRAVSEVLAELDADVIALQEVPRGYLPSGGVDMLGWLQRSLGMPYVAFQPSARGALHGNAVLSRYPIIDVDQRWFSRVGTALPRGAMAVELSVPGARPITVVATHLPPGGTLGERARRVDTVLDLWGQRPRTIVAADLNSQPGSDILRRFSEAGFESAWDVEDGPGHTYPSVDPRARIDWVLISPDMVVHESMLHHSTASDHLPLLAVVSATE